MALVRLSTRLNEVLTAADDLKAESLRLVTELATGDTTLGRLFSITDRATHLIATICDPHEGDTALAAYADEQFPEAPFMILERLAGVKLLLQAVVSACDSLVSPYIPSDLLTGSIIIVDGVGVPAPTFTPADTEGLRGVLQAIHDNIPQ